MRYLIWSIICLLTVSESEIIGTTVYSELCYKRFHSQFVSLKHKFFQRILSIQRINPTVILLLHTPSYFSNSLLSSDPFESQGVLLFFEETCKVSAVFLKLEKEDFLLDKLHELVIQYLDFFFLIFNEKEISRGECVAPHRISKDV